MNWQFEKWGDEDSIPGQENSEVTLNGKNHIPAFSSGSLKLPTRPPDTAPWI